MSIEEIEDVLAAYGSTGLWSESCRGMAHHGDCRGSDCDMSLEDAGLTADDLSFGSIENMRDDVTAFLATCEEERPGCFDGLKSDRVGHDFWLTRNGHGAGFWDRGLGELGDWLTQQCKLYGEASLWVGEDGRVYYQV